jgi:hypothetical protein
MTPPRCRAGTICPEMRIKIAIAAWKMWAAANKLPR